ncbi:MAG: LysM peptidoglycan-binding domain-containing protein [Tissierellia bacterium]|nr:LysM peptidoglycan-binding domain-containing protein [Tissierellia bacterium]
MRKFTKNEKVLLTLLGIIIIFWAAFRFVITPQASKLQILMDKRYEYEEKISYMNNILKDEKNIDEKWNRLYREKDMITNKYFSNLDQPEIIYLLNEILDNEELDVLDINFNRPSEEQINDLMVKTMNITIPYRSSYEGLIQTIKGVDLSPKKILISDLIMDKVEDNQLAGNISLKIYSLEGIVETGEDFSYIDIVSDSDKFNPFRPFDNYKEVDEGLVGDSIDNVNSISGEVSSLDEYNKEILEDFESEGLYFMPSNQNIKGSVSKSTNSKSKKYSLRFEYNIVALADENRAYIDLTDKNIMLKYPPLSIGLWVYSYNYSPATLGIRLKGQAGEKVDVELAKGISWVGWEYIEIKPPEDLSLYPLQLDRIYLELNYNRDDYGVLLFDKLEANYPKDNNKTKERFTFYIVEKGDTLDKISIKNYGTTKKKNLIVKCNEINTDKDIKEGKILVIPR